LSLRTAMVVNPIITRIGFPIMSRVKDDTDKLKSIYLQTLRMTASVNFPIYLAMLLFADELVELLFGPHWKDTAGYFRLLAAWGLVRSTSNPVGSLLYATGKARIAFWWSTANVFAFPGFYWLSAHAFGLPGLCWCVLVVQIVLVIPVWLILVRPYCGASLSEYLRQFMSPLVIASLAGVAAWLATRGIPHGTIRLGLGGTVGAAVYLLLSSVFNRHWFVAMIDLAKMRT
jgi:O-antigen/teichoic acid export membrane protein